MIILDFDGVLFDDARFKKAYALLLRGFGVSRRVFDAAYAATKKKHHGSWRYATHLKHIHRLAPHTDMRRLRVRLNTLIERSSQFVYRETVPFLEYWKKKGETLALLSNGCATHKKKVRASGLYSFFAPAIITETRLKIEPMRHLLRRTHHQRVVFIDDKKEVVDAIKSSVPRVSVIQMVRRKRQYRSGRVDAIVSNLAAARRFIERHEAGRR